MPTQLQTEIERLERTLDELERIERRILRTSGRLAGGPGDTGVRMAAERLPGVRAALGQAHEELEIEDAGIEALAEG